ncbi:MAG: MFS transporter [Dehalococcoidia bacterium]|nr:MFS transporter [Dehalococcoidia bacterium]
MSTGSPVLSSPTGEGTGLGRFFLALEVRPYRWLWGASFFGSMAFGMRSLADGWLALTLTDSPFWVGAAAGVQGLGQVVFGVFGGVLVDRLDRRKTLMAAQVATATLVLLIGLLVLVGRIALWHLLSIAFLQGLLMALQMPAANALIYQVVGPRRLLNAMAARMLAFNITRIVGSVVAGALISRFGVEACYLFAAGSLYLSPALLLFVKGNFRSEQIREPFWQAAREGIRYAWANGPVRTLLTMSVLMETFGFSYHVMLPVMARDVLNVGASGLGMLSAVGGAGAMVSTVAVAGLGDFKNKGALLVAGAGLAGVAILLFALSPWYPVSLGLAAVIGATLMAYDATMGTALQLLSSDAVRGRVLGMYGLTFGFTPLGGLLSGAIATMASAPVGIGLGGIAIVAFVLGRGRKLVRLLLAEQRVIRGPD